MERHHTGVACAVGAGPGNAMVGNLFVDLSVPLALDPANAGAPVKMVVIDLVHLLDPFHEAGEVLELGPLVVDLAHRNVNVDRFFYL